MNAATARIEQMEDGRYLVQMVLENNLTVDGWEEKVETPEKAQERAEIMEADWEESEHERIKEIVSEVAAGRYPHKVVSETEVTDLYGNTITIKICEVEGEGYVVWDNSGLDDSAMLVASLSEAEEEAKGWAEDYTCED